MAPPHCGHSKPSSPARRPRTHREQQPSRTWKTTHWNSSRSAQFATTSSLRGASWQCTHVVTPCARGARHDGLLTAHAAQPAAPCIAEEQEVASQLPALKHIPSGWCTSFLKTALFFQHRLHNSTGTKKVGSLFSQKALSASTAGASHSGAVASHNLVSCSSMRSDRGLPMSCRFTGSRADALPFPRST